MKGANFWKLILVTAVVLVAVYYLQFSARYYMMTPEQRDESPQKAETLFQRSFRLGLDIQGGLHLAMEIDTTKLPPDMTIDGDSDIKLIDQSEAVIRSRIDQFGVTEPDIRKVGNMRLIVDLPGISDVETAKELLQETALLEFKLVRTVDEITTMISNVDRVLASNPALLTSATEVTEKVTTDVIETSTETEEPVMEEKKEAEEAPKTEDAVADAKEAPADAEAEKKETEVVKTDDVKETEDKATEESKITATDIFADDSTIQTPPSGLELETEGGESKYLFTSIIDTDEGGNIYVLASDVARIRRLFKTPEIMKVLPRGSEVVWGDETIRNNMKYRKLFLLNKTSELTGDKLASADFGFGNQADPTNAGRPVVNLEFTNEGRRIFSRVTGANIKRRLAIVLNEQVYTAPVIQSKINHNKAQITGINNLDEAKVIAIVLRAGSLPAPLKIVEERTVGPSLGQDSIKKGIMATLIGAIVVLLFMLVYYKGSGLIADFAILLNMIILMAAMSPFNSTLTLPGIAGIILTVGMALDANVLIFERIREELRTGKTVGAAIDAGYNRAFRTILDANLTTFFTAFILYVVGTGPIKGFALTLMLGLVISMFTAIMVTRLIFDLIVAKFQPKSLSI